MTMRSPFRPICALLLTLLFLLTACGRHESSVPMPAVDRTALCDRLAGFRLENGGFQAPPDCLPESIYTSCFAWEYFRLSGQTDRCDAAPALPAGSRPEDRVRKMDAVDLFLWGIPMQAAIRDTPALLESLRENAALQEVLRFGPDSNYGDICRMVQLCEALGIDYDRALLEARWKSDRQRREAAASFDRQSDLHVAHCLNRDYGFSLDITRELRDCRDACEADLRAAFTRGDLPLYVLYEYIVLGADCGLTMGIGPQEAAQWLENYRTSEGLFDQLYQNGHSDPNATNMVYTLATRYGIPIECDTQAIDAYYLQRQQASGWYTDIDPTMDSDDAETFYVLSALRLLDADRADGLLRDWAAAHPASDTETVFADLLRQRAGDAIDPGRSLRRLEALCEKLTPDNHPYPYAERLRQLHLELDLLEQTGESLPDALNDGLRTALLAEGPGLDDFSSQYLRRLALLRLGDETAAPGSLARDLTDACSHGTANTDDLLTALLAARLDPDTAQKLRQDANVRDAMARLLEQCQCATGLFSLSTLGTPFTFRPTWTALLAIDFFQA